MKKQMIKTAMSIGELAETLQNIASDDNKEIADYTEAEILGEAMYVYSTFEESGHSNNEEMIDIYNDDPQRSKELMRQYRALIRFIKKYSEVVA